VCSFAHKTASTNRRSFNDGLRLTRQLCDTLNLDRTRERERLHGRFFGRQHELRMQYLEADKERRLLRCLTPRLILMVSGTFSAPKSVLVARLAYGRLRMAIKYGHSRVHIPALFARIAATLYYERSRRSGRKPFGMTVHGYGARLNLFKSRTTSVFIHQVHKFQYGNSTRSRRRTDRRETFPVQPRLSTSIAQTPEGGCRACGAFFSRK